RRFLGGGHSRKCPPPERAFAYFSHERKVSQGTGVKPPKLPGRMAVTDEENFSPPPARRYANLSASVPIAGTEPLKRGGVRTEVLTPLCAYTCCSPSWVEAAWAGSSAPSLPSPAAFTSTVTGREAAMLPPTTPESRAVMSSPVDSFTPSMIWLALLITSFTSLRSEERRVGKECEVGGLAEQADNERR